MDNKKVDGIKKLDKAEIKKSRKIVLDTIGEGYKPPPPLISPKKVDAVNVLPASEAKKTPEAPVTKNNEEPKNEEIQNEQPQIIYPEDDKKESKEEMAKKTEMKKKWKQEFGDVLNEEKKQKTSNAKEDEEKVERSFKINKFIKPLSKISHEIKSKQVADNFLKAEDKEELKNVLSKEEEDSGQAEEKEKDQKAMEKQSQAELKEDLKKLKAKEKAREEKLKQESKRKKEEEKRKKEEAEEKIKKQQLADKEKAQELEQKAKAEKIKNREKARQAKKELKLKRQKAKAEKQRKKEKDKKQKREERQLAIKEWKENFGKRFKNMFIKLLLIIFIVFSALAALYVLLVFVIVKTGMDSPTLRNLNKHLPIPVYITKQGVINYYTYNDVKKNLSGKYRSDIELEKATKIYIIEDLLLDSLIKKYNIEKAEEKTKDEIKRELKPKLVYDSEINSVGIKRINKIKEMIDLGEDFVKVANKYGDDQNQLTINEINRSQYDFYDSIKDLPEGENSNIVYTADGYYIFKNYKKTAKSMALSYVYIRAITIDEYLAEAIEGFRMWSFVD